MVSAPLSSKALGAEGNNLMARVPGFTCWCSIYPSEWREIIPAEKGQGAPHRILRVGQVQQRQHLPASRLNPSLLNSKIVFPLRLLQFPIDLRSFKMI